MKSLLMIALFLCLISGAQAKPSDYSFSGDRYAYVQDTIKAIKKKKHHYKDRHGYKAYAHNRSKRGATARFLADAGEVATLPFRRMAEGATAILGGRPAGCPHRFCGCGASLHLFGRIIPSLNLAANWLRFPRTAPAPNMAAARRGHVFVLKQHINGNVWLVYDANSGGHRTRIHPRSIAGYAIVNPHRG